MHNILLMNENNQLLINDISPNTNNFNYVDHFIKSSRLSSLSGLKLTDLFNGMANPECIVDPLILYATFSMHAF